MVRNTDILNSLFCNIIIVNIHVFGAIRKGVVSALFKNMLT